MRKYIGDVNIRKRICHAKRIVIKVGTSTITHVKTGKVNYRKLDMLARVLSDFVNQGKEVVLVSSGAIGVGKDKLRIFRPARTIQEKQAMAAVGQCELMFQYSRFFEEYGHVVGQILLTLDVINHDEARQNVTNTFNQMLDQGIIPIVNENDSVAIEEIKIGDNDNLSAIVATLIEADLLVVLSDIDGFYEGDPRKEDDARKFKLIEDFTPEIESCAGGKGSSNATGGMRTKIEAAKLASENNVDMVLASGEDMQVLYEILDGKEVGTLFAKKGN